MSFFKKLGKGISNAFKSVTKFVGDTLGGIFGSPRVELPPIVMPEQQQPPRQLQPDLPTLQRPTSPRRVREGISQFRDQSSPLLRLNDLLGLSIPRIGVGIGVPGRGED